MDAGTDKGYYLFNAHGDVVQLTDAAGTVTQTYDYDAFGNQKSENPADSNPFRYCGEYYDAETGTIYLRARYYDPSVGRFTSADVVNQVMRKLSSGIEAPDPLSLNVYTYCHNNPIMFIDPSGYSVAASWGSATWWLTILDGPLPIGDIIYVGGILVLGTVDVYLVSKAVQAATDTVSPEPYEEESSSSDYNWGNTDTLDDHYDRHGSDFKSENADDYARQANDFYNNKSDYKVKTGEDGTTRVYDPETNTFGAYNPDGSTRTFFKPKGGQGYFDRQPGK